MKSIYQTMWRDSLPSIRNNQLAMDGLIDDPKDQRYGLTLVLRPSDKIKQQCQLLVQTLRQFEPEQYYYPAEDIHITLLSIISCYDGFQLQQVNLSNYIEIINQSVQCIPPFQLDFKGITTSNAGVMLQGFNHQGTLNQCRQNLRQSLKHSTLQQSVDARYILQTAHSTLMRFRHPLNNPDRFIQILQDYRETDFGRCETAQIELVGTDWYHRKKQVTLIKTFDLHHASLGNDYEY